MTPEMAVVLAATVAAVPGCLAAWTSRRTHREIKTNHGVRAGQRIEDLTDDVAQIKRTMVTNTDLENHAAYDVEVAGELAYLVEQKHQDILREIRKDHGGG